MNSRVSVRQQKMHGSQEIVVMVVVSALSLSVLMLLIGQHQARPSYKNLLQLFPEVLNFWAEAQPSPE